jgi:hypothetical protein
MTAGRSALYYKFAEPKTFEWIPAHCHYNDALFRKDTFRTQLGTRGGPGIRGPLSARAAAQPPLRLE